MDWIVGIQRAINYIEDNLTETIDYEDVALIEFRDEIEDWIIEELQSIGCDTAKSVLELSVQELVDRTDLEEETIDNVIAVLKAEFEED